MFDYFIINKPDKCSVYIVNIFIIEFTKESFIYFSHTQTDVFVWCNFTIFYLKEKCLTFWNNRRRNKYISQQTISKWWPTNGQGGHIFLNQRRLHVYQEIHKLTNTITDIIQVTYQRLFCIFKQIHSAMIEFCQNM